MVLISSHSGRKALTGRYVCVRICWRDVPGSTDATAYIDSDIDVRGEAGLPGSSRPVREAGQLKLLRSKP
jgi:hypothetical protein